MKLRIQATKPREDVTPQDDHDDLTIATAAKHVDCKDCNEQGRYDGTMMVLMAYMTFILLPADMA